MFNRAIDQAVEKFATQFFEDNDRLVYRRGGVGAAYAVSPAERDTFVEQYRRNNRRDFYASMALFIAVLVAAFFTLDYFSIDLESDDCDAIMWVVLIILIGLYALNFLRRWYTPARELAQRVPVAPALTPHERRSKSLSQLKYGRILIAPLFAAYLIWSNRNAHIATKLVFFTLAVGLVAIGIRQFVRKALFDREQATP